MSRKVAGFLSRSLFWGVSIRLSVVLTVTCGSVVTAAVKPNPLFTNGAVLQQGVPVPVWGSAEPGERVTVRFQNQAVSTIAKDGRWMVRLKPLKAGGPFTLTISGENSVQTQNVLVGEVWVCSGQSNMQIEMKHMADVAEAIAAARDPMLRFFTVAKTPSETPPDSVSGKWQESTPETAAEFSAAAYYFGRELRKALGVPIGLINTAVGATSIQPWTPPEVFRRHAEFTMPMSDFPRWAVETNRRSVLYNGMVVPLQPYRIRGVIWYQGEGNAYRAYQYYAHFTETIRAWRKDWRQGDFPFLFVQLAPYQEAREGTWPEVREAQLLTSRNCPHTGMAVITDNGDKTDIHPRHKESVGARLALAALGVAYGKHVVYQGPVYRSMRVNGDRMRVDFDSVGGGLVAKGGELTGFTIASEDRKFYDAQAAIQGNSVVVTSLNVRRPVALRYGWANYPVVNLFNREGLPASPFRTDSFPGVTEPKR